MFRDRACVELKSLKLYIWSYRNEGAFHEAVTNRILDDLVGGNAAALHALDREVLRARRHLHHRRRRAPTARLATATASSTCCSLPRNPAFAADRDIHTGSHGMNPRLERAATVPVPEAGDAVQRGHADRGLASAQSFHRRAEAPDAGVHQARAHRKSRRPRGYPATAGSEALRNAIAAWLQRRYGLKHVDPAKTGAAGQRQPRSAVRIRADRGRRHVERTRRSSCPIRSIRSTKARRCSPAPRRRS